MELRAFENVRNEHLGDLYTARIKVPSSMNPDMLTLPRESCLKELIDAHEED